MDGGNWKPRWNPTTIHRLLRSSLQLSLTGVTLGENCQQLANGTNVEMNVFVKCSMDLTVASNNEHGVADTRGSQPTIKSCVIRKV